MRPLFIVIVLVICSTNMVFPQDTVRLGDSRYLFPQVDFKNGYIYKWNVDCEPYMGPSNVDYELGFECAMPERDTALIYGVAFPIRGNLRWNFDIDTLWLKIRRSIRTNGDGMVPDSIVAIDSVQITPDCEQKTLFLDEIWMADDHSLSDSIVREAIPLYCGYFDHPILMEDSSFFVTVQTVDATQSIHGETHYVISKCYEIYPTCRGYTWHNQLGHRSWFDSEIWTPILPIVVPPPVVAPDPEPEPNDIQPITQDVRQAVSVYPNPASGSFAIRSASAVLKVELIDAKGGICRTWESPSDEYGISTLAAGVYTVRVTTVSGVESKQLVINN